ncbi:CPBP family glutamic-type intramembrane protease [Pseudonocardia acaciae]|uniref:CPBP family glutamic-type intramembrane protease n=1 Tax=Pseudonocardia acaciae TaxID=551276 RepID=UPI00048BB5B5|nr:CPBP family glutamic-type intramembrane protease [Pseudonocardia acaciae]
MDATTPEGTRYHRLGVDLRYRWWSPLVELVIVGAVGLVLYAVVLFLAFVASGMGPPPGPFTQLILAVGWRVVLLPAVLVAVLGVRRRLDTVIGVAGHIRWRWLGSCAARALVVVALVALARVWTTGGWRPEKWPGDAAFAASVVVTLVAAPLSAAGWELARGWLLQVFGAWTGRLWPSAALATAVLMATMTSTWTWDAPLVATNLVVGLAMCWLAFRTGGLEAAVGLYAAQQVVFALLRQSQGVPALAELDPTFLELLPFVLGVLVYVWWTARAARPAPAPFGVFSR